MARALLIRLTPAGPWRNGAGPGESRRADPVCHSDTLYSALTQAIVALGRTPEVGPEWTEATAHDPGVTVTSLFPFLRDDLYAPPPRTLWPPPVAARLRAQGARFVPTRVVAQLLSGQPLKEDSWEVDAMSQCLVPRSGRPGHTGPFRYATRAGAAVDRLTGSAHAHQSSCIEFAPNAGYWCAAVFANAGLEEAWAPKIEAAFRLLADSGIGGRRSSGWGHSSAVEFERGELNELLFRRGERPDAAGAKAWWLLSLYAPGASDGVNWEEGSYAAVRRGGRTASGEAKAELEMIAEGSVLHAAAAPVGVALAEAPGRIRYGRAVAVPLPALEAAS
jgi:CRISPR type III-A-associated RAMP protein Csm4